MGHFPSYMLSQRVSFFKVNKFASLDKHIILLNPWYIGIPVADVFVSDGLKPATS